MATLEEARQVYRDYHRLWDEPGPEVAVWVDGNFDRLISWEDLATLELNENESIAWTPFIGKLEGWWGSEGVPAEHRVMELLVLDGRDIRTGHALSHPLPGQLPITK